MKRTATAAVLCTILVGTAASIAAVNASSPAGIPDLEGKTVVLLRPTYPLAQDVTLGVIGERQFLVMPRKGDDGLAYDYWIPLDSVSGLMVFDDMEDAAKYQARFSRTRGRSGSHAAQSPTPELPSSRLALDGACAVSYVELNAVVKGEEKFQSTYRGLRYNFCGIYNCKHKSAYW